eukprot:gene6128-6748_t
MGNRRSAPSVEKKVAFKKVSFDALDREEVKDLEDQEKAEITANDQILLLCLQELEQGNTWFARNEPNCAKRHYENAAKFVRQFGGLARSHYESVAVNNIGVLECLMGNYKEASDTLSQTLLLLRQSAQENGIHTTRELNMSSLNITLKTDLTFHHINDDEHVSCYSLLEHQSVDDLTADALMTLATIKYIDHQKRQARKLYEEAVALKERIFGPFSIQIAQCLQPLAHLEVLEGRLNEGEAYYSRILDTFIVNYGEEHLETAAAQNNLGVTSARKGDYLKGHRLLSRSLHVRRKLLGDKDARTIQTRNNVDFVANKLFHTTANRMTESVPKRSVHKSRV